MGHYHKKYNIYCFQGQEISHLIACQSVALKAVRLEALVPASTEVKERTELLDKFQVSFISFSGVLCERRVSGFSSYSCFLFFVSVHQMTKIFLDKTCVYAVYKIGHTLKQFH